VRCGFYVTCQVFCTTMCQMAASRFTCLWSGIAPTWPKIKFADSWQCGGSPAGFSMCPAVFRMWGIRTDRPPRSFAVARRPCSRACLVRTRKCGSSALAFFCFVRRAVSLPLSRYINNRSLRLHPLPPKLAQLRTRELLGHLSADYTLASLWHGFEPATQRVRVAWRGVTWRGSNELQHGGEERWCHVQYCAVFIIALMMEEVKTCETSVNAHHARRQP
jgi:hypothetical protein